LGGKNLLDCNYYMLQKEKERKNARLFLRLLLPVFSFLLSFQQFFEAVHADGAILPQA